MKKRLVILRIFLLLIVFILFFKIFFLQIKEGNYYQKLSKDNAIRLVREISPRGIIYDRNGKILADNKFSYDVFLFSRRVSDRHTINKLSEILKIDRKEIMEKLKDPNFREYESIKIKEGINIEEITKIEEDLTLHNVMIESRPIRFYPNCKLACSILGYVGEISKNKLDEDKDGRYKMGDIVGIDGIEAKYDVVLRGEEGGRVVEVDSLGKLKKQLGYKEPIPGRNLYLTIDRDLQRVVEEIMDKKVGAVIVINPHNGEILSMVSTPGFNPNFFIGKISKKEWMNIVYHPHKPLQNRAISNKYPPGSIFKIITCTAGLEEKEVNINSNFFCSGRYKVGKRTFRCWKRAGHGNINLLKGIEQSCDAVFYEIAKRVGEEKLTYFSKLFGLGKITGIDLPGESKGTVPNKDWKRKRFGERWYLGDTLNMGIGQGFLQITPLQAVQMVSVIANGGKLITPHLVKKIESDGNKTYLNFKTISLPISFETISTITEGMKMSVNSGTGSRCKIPGMEIAGKTGTADDPPRNKPHAWFVSFAPADKPEIALCVFVEQGGKGGEIAAPIARKIYEVYFNKNKK